MPSPSERKIIVLPDGPYKVIGGVPLCRKTQIVSEYGEPLTWRKDEDIPVPETYLLCRCGQSARKPFCDGTHSRIGFKGTERADTAPTASRQIILPGTHIVVKYYGYLCMSSGFCATRNTNIFFLLEDSAEPQVRSLIMAMIERCPSGTYTYSIEEGEPDIEPDLPQQIAVTTEITSAGPIEGPLWVTGYLPVERSDGKPFETRNRVTLCHCGRSSIKPLCDGAHRHLPPPR
jgi:CDGSH-type Zn-finger protein